MGQCFDDHFSLKVYLIKHFCLNFESAVALLGYGLRVVYPAPIVASDLGKKAAITILSHTIHSYTCM